MSVSEYEFSLKFAVPCGLERATLEACLFEAGCDDALLGSGRAGRMVLGFTRAAPSAEEAVNGALCSVHEALPQARLVEAEPDLVGVSDIADLFAFSRQNMRKLLRSYPDSFPLPLHEGGCALWHLADVLDWFEAWQARTVDPTLREVTGATMAVNAAREAARLDGMDEGRVGQQAEVG